MDKVNEIKINVPEGMEVYLENNTIKFRPIKKSIYEDIVKELFYEKDSYYIDFNGNINNVNIKNINCVNCFTNCTSEKQAKKFLAINKLMNVAKYFNNGWHPDWNSYKEFKYYLCVVNNKIQIDYVCYCYSNIIYFKSEEIAKQVIEILGEETIKLALCTDW